jgi:CBS domain-containing protein
MKVADLQKRQTSVRPITCAPNSTLESAAQLMAERNIGALPVTDREDRVVGMISERDISHAVARRGAAAAALKVDEFMSRNVATCEGADSVRSAMTTMSRRRVRHLPVVEEGKLVGVISQRDVLGALLEDAQLEVGVLRDVARARV